MAIDMPKSGIEAVGDMVSWGGHFCLFYETKEDLLDALVSYCKLGLERGEYCLWIVAEPLTIEQARQALQEVVLDFDQYLAKSSIEIIASHDLFLKGGTFDDKRVAATMHEKLASTSGKGYTGVRVTGDTSWLTNKDWAHFCKLEESINGLIGDQRLSVLCTYPLRECGPFEILDTVRTHQFAIARRSGGWDIIETATLKRAKAEIAQLNEELEQRVAERTAQLTQASAALHEAQTGLAHVNRVTTMGQLAASIAHEIKQPIAVAVGSAEAAFNWLGKRPPELEEVRQALSRIVDAGTQATDFIERIRNLYKKAPPRKDPFEINGALLEIIALTHGEVMKNKVSVQTQLGDSLPLVQGDRVQVQQVMLNLIINAVEAMTGISDGSRQLLIGTRKDASGGVLVTVQDSGPGLSLDSLDRLFDAFYTTKPDGMGMGLSICRSIVEAHGGRLWTASHDGPGAIFQFTLPTQGRVTRERGKPTGFPSTGQIGRRQPKLERSEWYDLCRDMNWRFKYVSEAEVFPEALSQSHGIPAAVWWTWDEPYKISYGEYVRNQAEKDAAVYSVRSAIGRSRLFENLDPGWKAAIILHYGAITMPEYLASIGEARMGRFGRAAAWRNMALFGTLDEVRHGQIQLSFPHALLNKEPRFDWAHKSHHTNEWGVIALRHFFDDVFTSNDAVSTALQLTFTVETGFTNLQFLGMAADAMETGDVAFGALISSIQTDEARHAQQGEPTLRVLVQQGKKAEAQRLIDVAFWRSWRIFALLTGMSMDYYTPLEHRRMSFKEFMLDWIVKQFTDQFRDLGLERPWYWELFLQELDWLHHAYHLGVWFKRRTVWWNPDAGVSVAEREWLEAKYPGWHDRFGTYWHTIAENVRRGNIGHTHQETLLGVCNICQLPLCSPTVGVPPRQVTHNGRVYTFCSDPCKWIFAQNPARYAGHLSIIDRFLAGHIQPPNMVGVLAYMGLSPAEQGDDAMNYAWAFEQPQPAVA